MQLLFVHLELVFDVIADDLLAARVRHAAEDAYFGRRRVAIGAENAAAVDPLLAQRRDERVAWNVLAQDRDRDRQSAEGEDVVDGVAGAAEEDVVPVLAEDEHRRLARDALRRSVDEAVRYDVAVDDDQLPLHRLRELEQAGAREHGRDYKG